MIRVATPADLPRLAGIEVAAGAMFATLGMALVADDDPFTVEELAQYQRAGRAWVAVDAGDAPVGYALALEVDGGAHLEQVSVHPDFAGRRLGAALVEEVSAWAADRGLPWLTLTTFAAVPWNAPYYERLGFEILPDADLGRGLVAIRADEAAHGLDTWPRVTMRRRTGA
ncbi:GNAT family N-acetyltransferase [Rhodococcus spelaei]|uniref:GNAT family N-acetyltransferase n=1 Tax=Rhodococcus spelaei TaxID=2546320 RepID=A0A541B8I8_9NOCA|nr:GNAT family N-acetyltransferase [Rhodococcus spelaei]TQF68640.1 GNAT family N-acetyltransferase [Rhodococcus spelaei]